ncbi:UNVERIFIED_CONTAM: DExH-box ATP-dependent RNA helicase DExH9 [Sesamum latifolium]|uniref:DExH-box ATP-dependent RNA helicase DExH9 n=1 Tax=Sesamum latifolium TaxID=2727402 RepID=A0AAW2XMV9_9LAMI
MPSPSSTDTFLFLLVDSHRDHNPQTPPPGVGRTVANVFYRYEFCNISSDILQIRYPGLHFEFEYKSFGLILRIDGCEFGLSELCSDNNRKVSVSIEAITIYYDILKLKGKAECEISRADEFYEIIQMTPVPEGSLIRAIRRLEEVHQQLIEPAKSIGETDLEAKFEDDVNKIKRDIVFAASKLFKIRIPPFDAMRIRATGTIKYCIPHSDDEFHHCFAARGMR